MAAVITTSARARIPAGVLRDSTRLVTLMSHVVHRGPARPGPSGVPQAAGPHPHLVQGPVHDMLSLRRRVALDADRHENQEQEHHPLNQDRNEQAQPFLYPGERLVAVCSYEPAQGAPTPPASLIGPLPPSALGREIARRLPAPLASVMRSRVLDPQRSAPAAAADAIDRAPDALDDLGTRLMHGSALGGGWQGMAGQFLIARARARGSRSGLLAVTDRRCFTLSDVSPPWRTAPQWQPAWEIPRPALTRLYPEPKGMLQKARLRLEFTDGSWLAVLASHPGEAQAFATAVTHG